MRDEQTLAALWRSLVIAALVLGAGTVGGLLIESGCECGQRRRVVQLLRRSWCLAQPMSLAAAMQQKFFAVMAHSWTGELAVAGAPQ
jgi:hypothetical protein